jgi:rubrerythrin
MATMVYCADEIIVRAIDIEMKAREFYRKAATLTGDERLRIVFRILAGMEKGHARIFRETREQLTESDRMVEVNDPGGEMVFYLDRFMEMHAPEANPGMQFQAGDEESIEELLRTAINTENDTVSFYQLLSDYVPADRGRERVLEVMKEEQTHAARLQSVLKRIETVQPVS